MKKYLKAAALICCALLSLTAMSCSNSKMPSMSKIKTNLQKHIDAGSDADKFSKIDFVEGNKDMLEGSLFDCFYRISYFNDKADILCSFNVGYLGLDDEGAENVLAAYNQWAYENDIYDPTLHVLNASDGSTVFFTAYSEFTSDVDFSFAVFNNYFDTFCLDLVGLLSYASSLE